MKKQVLEPLLVQHPGIKYSYLIEIKYIKPVNAKKQGPPKKHIDQLKREAEEQLLRYSMDKKFKKTIGQTTLRRLILIFCGNRMVHHGEVK